MARRYYRRRRRSDGLPGTLLLVGVFVVASFYNQLSEQARGLIMVGGLSLIGAIIVFVATIQYMRRRHKMVVTDSIFSRPARMLAESNDCILIGKDELAEWIIAFQEGK